jgi:ASC-1-like (ASCH) protein
MLSPYDVKEVKKYDHYRKMYETLKLDTLTAKEHTAQLGSQKAYDYQNAFINEK